TVAFAHVLLDALTVAVLYRLGRRIAGYRVGLGAALLYALNPSSWRFCNELLTEIFFGLLLTASVWTFTRYLLRGRNADALRCGVLFGLAILCKPNLQFLPLVFLVILVHGLTTREGASGPGRWLQGIAIIIGTILAMLMPWTVRNRVVFGEWFYTRTFDDNLAHVSAVATLAHVRGEAVAPWSARWEELYEEIIVRTALRYGWDEVDDAQLSARERDQRLQEVETVAREILREHPVDFISAHTGAWLWSLVPQEHKFWYTRLSGTPWSALPTEGDALGRALKALRVGDVGRGARILIEERLLALPPLALALWLGWGLLYAIGAVLFFVGALRMRPRILSFFFVATVFYVTFVPGPISQIRFRLPVTPLILLLMVLGALALVSPESHRTTLRFEEAAQPG
ncbi:MAG: ArnT family glycosyltransferase, partial [Anaerolineae bacterium]